MSTDGNETVSADRDPGNREFEDRDQPSVRKTLALYALLLCFPVSGFLGGESVSLRWFAIGVVALGLPIVALERTRVGRSLTTRTETVEDGRRAAVAAVVLAVVLVAAFVTVLVGLVVSAALDVGLRSWTVDWLSAVRFSSVFLGGILAAFAVDLRRVLTRL